MNITSVGGQELYKILFGREVATTIQMVKSDENGENKSDAPSNNRRLFDGYVPSEKSQVDPCASSVSSLFETGNKVYSFQLRVNYFKTDEDFARHFAEIGKRLDAAYSEGKFTEAEYNELNASLTDYIGEMKTKNDIRRAEREAFSSGRLAVNNVTGDPEEDKVIMNKFFEEKQKAIETILSRNGFVTELEKIMEMINQYRYASSNIVGAFLGEKR